MPDQCDEFDHDFEFLSPDSLKQLNYQQKILYSEQRAALLDFLRERGKDPKRHIGYEQSNIRPIAHRVHQVFEYFWDNDRIVIELSPEHADHFLEQLDTGEITTNNDTEYAEGSKRKFSNALEAYFRFEDVDWQPTRSFGEEEPSCASDPFNRRERELLLNTALEYKSPPSYSNVTPAERERWNADIAQLVGKPKSEVSPSDWDELRRSWKVPSIISTALDAGWRAEMVNRLDTVLVDLPNEQIIIPGEKAVKNNKKWKTALSKRSVKMLDKWLSQRSNKQKYDDTDALWLNRKGNRYNSKNLNDLLNNLMIAAGIETDQRTLTWHSIRHSTGMYIYDQECDLALVAEILRHKTLDAARKYAHPTPETKKDTIESIQGGSCLFDQ